MTNKKILLTGGSGDLGRVLSPMLVDKGWDVLRFDIRAPQDQHGQFLQGSVLDRDAIHEACKGVDAIVHIAAWHGIHEMRKEKSLHEFLSLNVGGTINVLDAAIKNDIPRVVYISSTSAEDKSGVYGPTKAMAETIVQTYVEAHDLSVISLRPRAFILHWNREVYEDFVAWVRWFWPGAVHIDDVAKGVELALERLFKSLDGQQHILPLDAKYEYSRDDLAHWDAKGPGSSFIQHYAEYRRLAEEHGLDISLKPKPIDIARSKELLGYTPEYSLKKLLEELKNFGAAGPPAPR